MKTPSSLPMLRLLVLGSALGAAATGALALDYPARKPGLWEMAMQSDAAGGKMPVMRIQQCIDAATDKALRDMGSDETACSASELRADGDKLIVDSVCSTEGSQVTMRGVMTGDFHTAYRMENHSTYRPPLAGQAKGTMVIDAKWLGPCKAGQKPGDMVMPGGMKMNVLQLKGGKK